MAIIFAWSPKILQQHVSWLQYKQGKELLKNAKKCDRSDKHDFSNKNSVHNTEKWQFRYLLSEKIENQII